MASRGYRVIKSPQVYIPVPEVKTEYYVLVPYCFDFRPCGESEDHIDTVIFLYKFIFSSKKQRKKRNGEFLFQVGKITFVFFEKKIKNMSLLFLLNEKCHQKNSQKGRKSAFLTEYLKKKEKDFDKELLFRKAGQKYLFDFREIYQMLLSHFSSKAI